MDASVQHVAAGVADGADAFLERLLGATNAHDPSTIANCFSANYRNETPAHPSRGFEGRDQVRRNWEQILAHVPDLVAVAPRRAVAGDVVWAEMEMRGTRRDGAPHLMRGVVIFGVHDGRAAWARFYVEPVVDTGEDANETVRRLVRPPEPGAP